MEKETAVHPCNGAKKEEISPGCWLFINPFLPEINTHVHTHSLFYS